MRAGGVAHLPRTALESPALSTGIPSTRLGSHPLDCYPIHLTGILSTRLGSHPLGLDPIHSTGTSSTRLGSDLAWFPFIHTALTWDPVHSYYPYVGSIALILLLREIPFTHTTLGTDGCCRCPRRPHRSTVRERCFHRKCGTRHPLRTHWCVTHLDFNIPVIICI